MRCKAVVLAALAASTAVLPARPSPSAPSARAAPFAFPTVSPAEAQTQLGFPIALPSNLEGGKVRGVQVQHIVSMGGGTEAIPEKPTPLPPAKYGFGLMYTVDRDGHEEVIAFPNGPGGHAGVPAHFVRVLSIDGQAKPDPPTFGQLIRREPITLTFEEGDGTQRTVTVPHKGMYVPWLPPNQPPEPVVKFAVVYIDYPGEHTLVIRESPAVPDLPFDPPHRAPDAQVGGRSLYFDSMMSGGPNEPNVTWTEGGVNYWIQDHALPKPLLFLLIASMPAEKH